ncbi:MAG: ABC transporter ATP-binding protein [Shinella sp.]|nr:ABC transporter ATP-binding protein [Shinella sp.]
MTSISIRNLTKSFGSERVLRGIDLDLPEGKILALLGPSGCGKTTLLRLIAGFDAVGAGEIVVGGRPVASARSHVPPERRRIGYVPQEGALFPHLTLAGNVAFGLRRGAGRVDRVREILKLTGLEELGQRYPRELSGGQQQRGALARALAPSPEIVLLDEPFNALDLDLRRALCEEVTRMLRKSRATAILVTHDPQEAFVSADYVAVMQSGRIMQFGSPEAVYHAPLNADVARITGGCVLIEGRADGKVVQTDLGPIALSADLPAVQGAVTVMLRPEQIRISRQETGVAALLKAASFRGAHTDADVAVGDREIRISVPGAERLQAGATVWLTVEGACAAYSGEGEMPDRRHRAA